MHQEDSSPAVTQLSRLRQRDDGLCDFGGHVGSRWSSGAELAKVRQGAGARGGASTSSRYSMCRTTQGSFRNPYRYGGGSCELFRSAARACVPTASWGRAGGGGASIECVFFFIQYDRLRDTEQLRRSCFRDWTTLRRRWGRSKRGARNAATILTLRTVPQT